VTRIIQATNRLDVLNLASSTVYPRTLGSELPSWVPDFNQRATSTINSSFSSLRSVSADGNSLAIVSFEPEMHALTAQGFIVDIVDGLAQVLGTSETSDGRGLHQSKSKPAANSLSDSTRAIREITQSLIAGSIPPTLTLDEVHIEEIANRFVDDYRQFTSNLKSHGHTTSSHLLHWFNYNQDFVVFGKPMKQWAHEYYSSTPSKRSPGGFFDYRSSLHWDSRRLFTTVEGCVGLGWGEICADLAIWFVS